MNKTQAELVAKIIRHKAVDVINATIEKSNIDWFMDSHTKSKFTKLIDDISRDIINIDTMKTLSENNSNDKGILERMLTKHAVLERMEEKGMSMDGLQIGSWTCESSEGVGICVVEDRFGGQRQGRGGRRQIYHEL